MPFLVIRAKSLPRIIAVAGVIAATVLVHGCDDELLPTGVGEPPFRIADAAHGGHNLDFFFLPPLVPDPSERLAFDDGGFDDGQSPEVKICALVGDDCTAQQPNDFPIIYTMTEGAGSEVVRVSVPPDEHYVVNWHTNEFTLDTDVTYRISVSVAGTELGFADVDVVGSGKELKSVITDEFIALKDGRTLPIKFRIEHGAVYLVDGAGGTVSAADGKVTLEISADALGETVGLTVQPASGYAAPPLVPGTAYDFGPDGLTFSSPVTLTIAYDEPDGMDESSLRIHKLVSNTWEVVPDGTVDLQANTATAEIEGFSTYLIAERDLAPIPPEHRIVFFSDRAGNFDIYSLGPDGLPHPLIEHEASDIDPAISPDGTWLAFTSDRDGGSEIYVSDIGGTAVQQLTFGLTRAFQPNWSPDGTKLAFTSTRDGNWEVYVINADGSDPTNLTNDPGNDFAPDWSPDGNRIAFSSNRDGDQEIYTMNADGSGLQQITVNDAYGDRRPDWSPGAQHMAFDSDVFGQRDVFRQRPLLGQRRWRLTNSGSTDWAAQWSPDGQHILFSSNRDGNDEVYVMNADGSGQTNLTENSARDGRPTWGVYGERQFPSLPYPMAFQSDLDGDTEIYIYESGGTRPVQLTHNSDRDESPAWSPDGWQLSFSSDRGGEWDLYVMNRDGSGLWNLTDDPTIDELSPNWSPDGSRIVYVCGDLPFNADICVVDASGNSKNTLTNSDALDLHPVWSPNGTRIAFHSDRSGNYDIYVMNGDGTALTQLTTDPSLDVQPSWSPSGGSILFSSGRDGSGRTHIFRVPSDGSADPTQLTDEPSSYEAMPVYSPDARHLAFVRYASGRNSGDVYFRTVDGTGAYTGLTPLFAYPLADERWPAWRKVYGASGSRVWTDETPTGPPARWGSLAGIWGSGATDMWAVGTSGSLVHFDGTGWTEVTVPTVADLYDVWGTGPGDVWAVANPATILHFDGATWAEQTQNATSSPLYGLWASGPEDVWAVGEAGLVIHNDGNGWVDATPEYIVRPQVLWGIWGSAPNDIWAVGTSYRGSCLILHYDGATWTDISGEAGGCNSESLSAVWGTGPSDVWAVGELGTILRYNGTYWRLGGYDSGTGPPTDVGLYDVWGTGVDDVWAVGREGTVLHFDGESWEDVAPGLTDGWLGGVWGAAFGEVWVVGEEKPSTYGGTILRGVRFP